MATEDTFEPNATDAGLVTQQTLVQEYKEL